MRIKKSIPSYLFISVLAFLSAVNYIIFVFPNHFAPSGLDGICTMIQDVLRINMGYLALVANLPLLFFAFLYLNRDFAIKNAIYILVFSLSVILLKTSPLPAFSYHTSSGTSTVLAPIAGGAIRGAIYAATLRQNAGSGGVDIAAALIRRKTPHFNLMYIIFTLNAVIAVASYFVYGYMFEPVICSILYAFVTSRVSVMLEGKPEKDIKYEIITEHADAFCKALFDSLHETATVLDAHGAFSGDAKKMVVCVVSIQKAPYLDRMLLSFQDAVIFKCAVQNTAHHVGY